MSLRFALLNQSRASSDDMERIADAGVAYLADLCDLYSLSPIAFGFFPNTVTAPVGWIPIIAFDRPSGDGYLGFHDTMPDGTAYADVYLDAVPDQVVLHDPSGRGASLAGVITHELAEASCDLYANQWSDGPLIDPRNGRSYNTIAYELCDYVQNRAKAIEVGGVPVDVSNFVTREFFCSKIKAARFDYLGVLTAPCTIDAGGYAIVEDSGAVSQAFGRRSKIPHHESPPPVWRDAHSAIKSASRTKRRIAEAFTWP